MKKKTWIAIAIITGVFVLGMIAGASSAYCFKNSFRENRRVDDRRHDKGRLVAHIERKMTRMLKLSPKQVKALRPIWEKLGDSFDKIQRETRKKISDLILEAQDDINSVLTEEQQELFKRRMKKMGHIFDAPPRKKHAGNRECPMPDQETEVPMPLINPPQKEAL